MNKASLPVIALVATTLILSAMTFLPERVGATTLYVGGGGPGNYTKIQAALDDANPGETIYVYSGAYSEKLVVHKPIFLIGEDRTSTTIQGDGIDSTISVVSDWVSITNFTVNGGGGSWDDAGIKLNLVRDCNISFNNVSSNSENGIYLDASANNTIVGNEAWNVHSGVHLRDSNYNTISFNNISGGTAFVLIDSSYNALSHNVALDSYRSILLDRSHDNVVSDNTILPDMHEGVYVRESDGNRIVNNTFHSKRRPSVHLESSGNAILEGNVMDDNGIFITGDSLWHWNTHTIDESNTLNGKPIRYWRNRNGGTVPQGSGQVLLANCKNVVIENQNVSKSFVGIELGFSSNNTIANNTASHNSLGSGILLRRSTFNTLINNTARWNDAYGIGLIDSHNNVLTHNVAIEHNDIGIALHDSTYNIIRDNFLTGNEWFGVYFLSSHNNSITNNTMLQNHIYLAGGHYNTISGNTVSDTGRAIALDSSDFNTVLGNVARNSTHGIWVSSGADSNTIAGNRVSGNQHGILNNKATTNLIWNNTVWDNEYGIHSGGCWWPRDNRCENNIIGNHIHSNDYGIYLTLSNNTTVVGNTVADNVEGIYVTDSHNNSIYHNNIGRNSRQAFDDTDANHWDDGYPSGGNYWSDYLGDDIYSGPGQDLPGSDGIGDTPYVIDMDSRDRYPLVSPRTDLLSILLVGQPNFTSDRNFLTSSTPLVIESVNLSGGEVFYTEYRIDEGDWNLYSHPFSLLAEGIHPLEYRSSDAFGELEPIRNNVLVVDDTPPVSQIAVGQPSYSPDDLWVRSSTPLALSATEPPGNMSLSARVEDITIYNEPIGQNEQYEDYLARSNHTVARVVWPGLQSVTFHVTGALCLDVDIGVFLDANSDSEPQSTELVAYDADADADETVVIQDPLSGTYIVVVAGYNVPPAGCLADLEVIQVFGGNSSSGLGGILFRVWNGSAFSDWGEYTDNFTIQDEGLAYIEHSAYDNLANEEAHHNLTLYVDDTPPESETESFDRADGGYDVQLTFQDSGCGVASTHYRLDGNPWQDSNLSEISLTLTTPGIHTIEFYAIDNLGNVEVIDSLVLEITAPAEPNWKPLVALIFTFILIAVGFLRSQKRPIPFGDSRGRRLKTFILLSGPFVIAEALTGLASLILGVPSIPPLMGWGTALDIALLLCGVIVAIAFPCRGSEGVSAEREQDSGSG